MLRAHSLSIENDPEDDGLFMITLWTYSAAPGYVTLCRDLQDDEPGRIWFEWQDQITGRYVDGLRFEVDGGVPKIAIVGPHAFAMPWPDDVASRFDMAWAQDACFEVDVSTFDTDEIASVLASIQDAARA